MTLLKSLPSQLPKLRFLDRFMANHSGYIAGGCFKGLFAGEKIKDVDVFFTDAEKAKAAVSYFTTNSEFKPGYSNDRVASFVDSKTGIRVEVIFGFVGEAEQMLSNFDFTITKAAYIKNADTSQYEFIFHERFFEHLSNRKLVIDDKVLFPISTFERSLRYTRYGFNLCGESKSRIIQSVQGFTNISLNDFYAGID